MMMKILAFLQQRWSPYVAAILLVGLMGVLIAHGGYWGVFGGIKVWANNAGLALGVVNADPYNPQHWLLNRSSIMSLCLILGAFCAANLANQFHLIIPRKRELLLALLGGSLMGIGASLAGGCTVGGFFTPLLFSSPAGWTMAAGLLLGAYWGIVLLTKWVEWMPLPQTRKGFYFKPNSRRSTVMMSFFSAFFVAAWALNWAGEDQAKLQQRVIYIVTGFAIGFLLQRSRFCFASIFRTTVTGVGDSGAVKALLLALTLAIPMVAVLLQYNGMDPYLPIPASFWMGSLLGGMVFGVGMTLAGGCASSTLWRAAEGNLKHWIALACFAAVGLASSIQFEAMGLSNRLMTLELVEQSRLGSQVFLPDLLKSWWLALLINMGLLLAWFGVVVYRERRGGGNASLDGG
jgi:uncharacterized membrane protein YedE/YeeE